MVALHVGLREDSPHASIRLGIADAGICDEVEGVILLRVVNDGV